MNNAQGLDVSKWDGGWDEISKMQTIDFSKYGPMLDFCSIKVSEWFSEDPLFRRQWDAARGRTVRFPYHFFRSGADQKIACQKMVSILGDDPGEVEAVLDAEAANGSDQVMSLMHVWCNEYNRISGRWPMIYSTRSFLSENGAGKLTIYGAYKNAWLANCRLWLAEWPFDELDTMPGYPETGDALRAILIQEVINGKRLMPWPKPPAPFKQVDYWQWTSRYPPGQVPGYYMGLYHKEAVDMNFHRDNREIYLAAHPIGGTTPPPGGTAMQYKVVWSNGATERPQPNTGGTGGSVHAFGSIVDAVQDGIADSVDPGNANKRWVKLTNGQYVASNYPDGIGPQVRMTLVGVTPPPPPPSGSETVTAHIELVDKDAAGTVTATYKGDVVLTKQ